MTQRAVALVYRPGEPMAGTPRGVRRGAGSSGAPRRTPGWRLRGGRLYLGLGLAIVVGIWLVLVFGRALSDLNAANANTDAARAEVAALEARLEAMYSEIEIVQSDQFMSMQARQYGMGRPGERAFALASGAPPPPAVVPLGGESAEPSTTSPLDAWLSLLVGTD